MWKITNRAKPSEIHFGSIAHRESEVQTLYSHQIPASAAASQIQNKFRQVNGLLPARKKQDKNGTTKMKSNI